MLLLNLLFRLWLLLLRLWGAAAQNVDAAGVVGAAAQAVVEAVGAAVGVFDAGAAAQAGAVADAGGAAAAL